MQARSSAGRMQAALPDPRAIETVRRAWAATALAGLLLAGCASAPQGGGAPGAASAIGALSRPSLTPDAERDGPDAQPPPGLLDVPDAEPRIEPIRTGGPNKPYEVLGREYVPLTEDRPFVERGLATWYGRKFQGRRTSSGELYNMYEMTAAHPTLPIPSYARVRNPANGREVVVRINDRGPFHPGRIVDLSYTAALKLDLLRGAAPVEIERITQEDIRSGTWRRAAPDTLLADRTANARLPVSPAPSAPTIAATEPGASPARAPLAEGTPRMTQAETGSAEPTRRAYTAQAQGFWVQIGAFRERSGAEALQRRIAAELEWLAPLMAIFNESMVHRLQAGPYASRTEASSASQRIRQALQVVPVIVERR